MFKPTMGLVFLLVLASPSAFADRTLVHEIVIDAPVADVWRVSTTSEGCRLWMAPKVEVELRVGGSFRASYHPESNLRDEHTIVNRILSYAPQRMLAIQNVKAPHGFQHMEFFQRTWTVISFESVGAKRTRVRMIGLGYGEGPEWDYLYDFFEQGNNQVLHLLGEAVKAWPKDVQDERRDGDRAPAPEQTLPPIETQVVVGAPADDVWRAWTAGEGVEEFLGVGSKIDLRIGGAYEFYFGVNLPEGSRGSEGCRILAYEPKRMLSFSWSAPPNLPFAREHHTWVVIDFDEVEEGVRVRLTHYGFAERVAEYPAHGEEFEAARAYFERAWPSVLAKLKAHFE